MEMSNRRKTLKDVFVRNDIPSDEWRGIIETAKVLKDDADGLWSMMQDYGWDISYEDVQKIIEVA